MTTSAYEDTGTVFRALVQGRESIGALHDLSERAAKLDGKKHGDTLAAQSIEDAATIILNELAVVSPLYQAQQQELRRLRATLALYADADHYDTDGMMTIGDPDDDSTWEPDSGQLARAALTGEVGGPAPVGLHHLFQSRVRSWVKACFGEAIADDGTERNHRFLEEALELVQALGCTEGEAQQLVKYVYGRPEGEPEQELGGVMVTLAALAAAWRLDMRGAGEKELARVWTKLEQIRAKQAAKPKHSPLPQTVDQGEN